MNIALIGYGTMGKLLETRAVERGHKITGIVDAVVVRSAAGTAVCKDITSLEGADVALEFTRPEAAVGNILGLAARGIPTVVGTTGWYDRLGEVQRAVEAAGTALLWASNFSLGVNLFYCIAEAAAHLINPFAEYDVGGWETHHNRKADSPSGTAKALVERVLRQMPRKQTPVWESLVRPPAPEELHFPSLRVGATPGTHALVFDSEADSIEIRHTARNREGLAAGALTAAEWLVGCSGPGAPAGVARQGVFTMNDVLGR